MCRANRVANNNIPHDARMMRLPNKIVIKKQTITKMNLDLSLMTYLFGESFNRRFNEQEKLCKKDESNVKYFHI